MGKLTACIVQGIENAREFDDFSEFIWMAGDLIRKSTGMEYHSGFEEVDREEVSEAEGKLLKEAILRALPRNSDPAYVGSLLSALRQTFDPDLLPLWNQYLAKYLGLMKQSSALVFNILLALGDLGQPVFQGRRARCVVDMEVNLNEADAYLLKRGVKIQW